MSCLNSLYKLDISAPRLPCVAGNDAPTAERLLNDTIKLNDHPLVSSALSNLPERVEAALNRISSGGITDLGKQLIECLHRVEVCGVKEAADSALLQVRSFRDVLPAFTVVDGKTVSIYVPASFLQKTSKLPFSDRDLVIESFILESLRCVVDKASRSDDVNRLFTAVSDTILSSSFDRLEPYDSKPHEVFIARECSESLRASMKHDMRFALVAIHCAPAFSESVNTVESIHDLLSQPNITACYENVYYATSGGMTRSVKPGAGSFLSHWGFRQTQRYNSYAWGNHYLPAGVDLREEQRFVLTGGAAAVQDGQNMRGACLHRAFCELLEQMEESDKPFEIHLPFGGPIYHGKTDAGSKNIDKDVLAPFIWTFFKGEDSTVIRSDHCITMSRTDMSHGTQTVYFWPHVEAFKQYSRSPHHLCNLYQDIPPQSLEGEKIRWQDNGRRFEVCRLDEEPAWFEISGTGENLPLSDEIIKGAFRCAIERHPDPMLGLRSQLQIVWEAINRPTQRSVFHEVPGFVLR